MLIFNFSWVRQEDCSQHDSVPDEVAQRSADLDDLDDIGFDLEELGVHASADYVAPAPHHLSRSLSRISRTDTHRVGDSFLLIFLAFFTPGKTIFCLIVSI